MGPMFTDFLCVKSTLLSSGVARAIPGGRLAHPEGQNEEENKFEENFIEI